MKDSHYMSQRTSHEYREGPRNGRGFTDCCMLFTFIAAWVGFIFITIHGIQNGSPTKVYKPYDSNSNQCGENNATNFPYLYWVDPVFNVNHTVCVNSCPIEGQQVLGIDNENYTDSYGNTEAVIGLCIPLSLESVSNITSMLGIGTIQQTVADIQAIWYMLFAIAGIALTISFIYTIFMKYCSSFMTWGILLIYLIFLGLLGYFSLQQANNPGSSGEVSNVLNHFSSDSLKFIGYTSWVALGISLLLICIFFHKIELSVAVLKCSAQFVEDVPSIILIPPFFFVLLLGYTIFWIFSFVSVVSCNQIVPSGYPFPSINWVSPYQYETLYLVFIYLWNHAFFLALPQFVIASACVCWYFRKANNESLGHPVCWGLCNNLIKHLGSIAFGSLIIAIVEVIRLVMDYVHEKLKPVVEGNAAGFILKCVNCCLDCFERFIRFINTHAYIQIAMTGENFCKAAEESFALILRYAASLGITHGLGSIFVFIGTICITAASSLIGYILLTQTALQNKIFSPVFPTIIFALISYVIGSNFMSVFGTSADTIIHCYCIDDELHEGMGGAQHAPEALRHFIEHHQSHKKTHEEALLK